jgi:DNA-binding protein HU-beta
MHSCFRSARKDALFNGRDATAVDQQGRGRVMTKAELIEAVAKTLKLKKTAAGDVVDATFDHLARAIRKDKRFQVPGFGTFTVRSRKARKGRDPQTGAEISIKASRTVGFRPAPDLKKSL